MGHKPDIPNSMWQRSFCPGIVPHNLLVRHVVPPGRICWSWEADRTTQTAVKVVDVVQYGTEGGANPVTAGDFHYNTYREVDCSFCRRVIAESIVSLGRVVVRSDRLVGSSAAFVFRSVKHAGLARKV